MASCGKLRRVVLVRTDVSEERIASTIKVTIIGDLRTTFVVTSNRSKLRSDTFLRNVCFYKSHTEYTRRLHSS
jgi:hypothetical protein